MIEFKKGERMRTVNTDKLAMTAGQHTAATSGISHACRKYPHAPDYQDLKLCDCLLRFRSCLSKDLPFRGEV